MKTTLNIDENVMAQLKRGPARQGHTMSELVETALWQLFRSRKSQRELVPLPAIHSGGTLVDVADRQALPSHGRPLVLVVDTNIPVSAADADSQIHECPEEDSNLHSVATART